jgi:hypothetical protein
MQMGRFFKCEICRTPLHDPGADTCSEQCQASYENDRKRNQLGLRFREEAYQLPLRLGET